MPPQRGEFQTPGYKDLRAEFVLMSDGDEWGTAKDWWFACAELLYHQGIELPGEWQFHDSPLHIIGYVPEEYADVTLDEWLYENRITTDDVMLFARVLTRYLNMLRSMGKEY